MASCSIFTSNSSSSSFTREEYLRTFTQQNKSKTTTSWQTVGLHISETLYFFLIQKRERSESRLEGKFMTQERELIFWIAESILCLRHKQLDGLSYFTVHPLLYPSQCLMLEFILSSILIIHQALEESRVDQRFIIYDLRMTTHNRGESINLLFCTNSFTSSV